MKEAQPVRILVIENEITKARRLREKLEGAGYSVVHVRDGEEGIARAVSENSMS